MNMHNLSPSMELSPAVPGNKRLLIYFCNIGSYHAARLRAAHQALAPHGWSVIAMQSSDLVSEYSWGELDALDLPVITLFPSGGSPRDVDGTPQVAPLARQTATRLRPDLVAVAGWAFPELRAVLGWARKHSVPSIVFSESKRDDASRRWWRESLKSRLLVRHCDAAIVGGQAHRDYVISLGIQPERVFVGYDVVDNAHFFVGASRARLGADSARATEPGIPVGPYFLASSRFIDRKNLPRLVEAYADYRQRVPPGSAWHLVLLGSGVEETRIRQTIASHALEDVVHLPGFVPYRALPTWYGLASAFVHPALQEPWGLVVNEACASGLPILCSRTTGACHDLVREGQSGFLFEPADVPSMSRALVRLHLLPEETRLRMGKHSAELARAFDVSTFGSALARAVAAIAPS